MGHLQNVEQEVLTNPDRVPVPTMLTATRVTGLPVIYSLLTDEGRAYVMYLSQQIKLLRTDVSPARTYALCLSSLQMAPQVGARDDGPSTTTESGKWCGQLVHPSPVDIKAGVAALALSSDHTPSNPVKAVEVAVNGRLGLVAVGTDT